MTIKQLQATLKLHKLWLDGNPTGRRADLCGADLRRADLRGADLCQADLREADLDFSCWPLWCGTMKVKIGDRLFYQLIAHVRSVDISQCKDPDIKRAYKYLTKLAKKCHRAQELHLT